MARHDEGYKLLFSHPEMMTDLLRGFVDEPWVEELDFSSLEQVASSYVSEDLRERLNDLVWKVRWRGREVYLYLLLEFQSRTDPRMALRVLSYVSLLLQDLGRSLGPGQLLPPVLPMVLYNGLSPWAAPLQVSELIIPVPGLERFQPDIEYLLIDENRYDTAELASSQNLVAALFRLEKSRGPEEVRSVVAALLEWLRGPERQSLRRTFASWLTRVLLPTRMPVASVPEIANLQEVQNMLEQRVQEWTETWKQEGIEEGLVKGRLEGREEGLRAGVLQGEIRLLRRMLELRFGALDPAVQARIEAASADQLLVWGERLLVAESLEDLFASGGNGRADSREPRKT